MRELILIYSQRSTVHKNTLLRALAQPYLITLGLSLILITFNLIVTHRATSYTSDDVSWQNELLTWHPFAGHRLYLAGSDTYIIRAPLYAALGRLFAPSRKLLLLESSILAIANFIFFYVAALYFLRKLKVKLSFENLLPFVWLSSFGYSFSRMFLNSNLRSFEIGLGFMTFVLAAKYYYGEIAHVGSVRSLLAAAAIALFVGILIYNDPYYFYFTALPILALFGVLYALNGTGRRQALTVAGLALLGFLASKLVARAASAAGAAPLFSHPIQFVGFDKLSDDIGLALHGTLVLVGADFFGGNALTLPTLSALANFAVVSFCGYQAYRLIKNLRPRGDGGYIADRELWPGFFAWLSLFVPIVYVLSDLAVSGTFRYLIMLAYTLVLFSVIRLSSIKSFKSILTLTLCLAIVGNVGVSIVHSRGAEASATNAMNSENLVIIDKLRAYGLTKGYAPYWDGNINSYLSGGAIEFLPITCDNTKTVPLHYLVDTGQFSRPASKSFYIIDPSLSDPPTCSRQQALKQFGQPAKVLPIGDKEAFIYPYDIYSKMLRVH